MFTERDETTNNPEMDRGGGTIQSSKTKFSKNDVQLSEHLANITEICDYNAKVLGLQYEKPQIVIGDMTLEEQLACRNIGKVYDAIHQTFDLYLSSACQS